MASQNCVNEGTDHRIWGGIVCKLQQWLSYKSESGPKWLIRWESGGVVRFGIAYPLYIVVQWGHWNLFRLGWRYDVNWKGFIAPTAAFKTGLAQPMEKGY